jgi:NAD(P)-dependent dehydrogenase (short-subunit alcohol dehydrogenase family)
MTVHVPLMREQRSGCILQISSVGGRLTRPGSTPYHAAKWAVGGFTESFAQELSPFGVKVCALDPEACGRIGAPALIRTRRNCFPDYEPSVGAVAKALKSYWGKGDQ